MSSDTATAGSGSPSGVIHDIGYRTYTGERVGRLGIVRALYWHSFRSAWGLGRGPRAKIVPLLALVIMCLPAIANAFSVSRTGVHAIAYDEYMYSFQLVLVLYLAAVTPELISRDIRNRTLPLYFSRPLRRTDYPIAKIGALITAMLVLTALPEMLLYVGTIGSLHGGSAVWRETRAFMPGAGAGAAVLDRVQHPGRAPVLLHRPPRLRHRRRRRVLLRHLGHLLGAGPPDRLPAALRATTAAPTAAGTS